MKIMEPSTPRRSSRRNSSFSSSSSSSHANKESKNPYSASGLDKFSALLAKLEEKKQKIYSQVNNPDEISLVRFVFKDSDDIVPIVVKMKKRDHKQEENKLQIPPRNQDSSDHHQHPSSSSSSSSSTVIKRFSFSLSEFTKLSNWRQPCYYLPAVIVLILLFLVFFGRSFAILCTSIGWYIVPTLKSKLAAADHTTSSSNPNSNVITRSVKKKNKEYLRIYSDNKMVTTTNYNNHSGVIKKHSHKKSW